MTDIKASILKLEKEIENLLGFVHDLKEKNYSLIKENDDLKNKLSIFQSDISTVKSGNIEHNENKELIKLKEKQDRIKLELNGILEHINSVLN